MDFELKQKASGFSRKGDWAVMTEVKDARSVHVARIGKLLGLAIAFGILSLASLLPANLLHWIYWLAGAAILLIVGLGPIVKRVRSYFKSDV